MLSKNIINKFLFISIILLAIIAGWAVSELFNKDSTSPSNNILLNFEAVDHMGNNVSTSSYDGFNKVFFFWLHALSRYLSYKRKLDEQCH